jgi:hypothetical protein
MVDTQFKPTSGNLGRFDRIETNIVISTLSKTLKGSS